MAFGGAATVKVVGPQLLVVEGLSLAANVGAADPTGVAADTGVVTSNNGAIDTPIANAVQLPADLGPGEDNWTQAELDALEVLLNDAGPNASNLCVIKSLVPNVNPAPPGSAITNNNINLLIHSKGAVTADAIEHRFDTRHTIAR